MLNTTLKNTILTYITTAIAGNATFSSVEQFGPNDEDPDVETRTLPLITIDLDETGNRQYALGSRNTRKTGHLVVTLFVRVGSGINLASEFKGFMDSIGLQRVNGVTYKEPLEVMVPKEYKGWAPVSVALPFMLDNLAA